jgi:1,4-dihydroxy-2-naphthoate octaprenyltransferase
MASRTGEPASSAESNVLAERRLRSSGLIVGALVSMSRPSHIALILFVAGIGAVAAIAGGRSPEPATVSVAAIALLLVAASVHLANEWADHATDALTTRTPFSGGSGTLPRTGLSPALALNAALAAAVAGVVVAIVGLVAQVLPSAAAVLLIVGGLMGWAYSVPPLALAWRGFGELDNALAGGLVLPLFGYAALGGQITWVVVAVFLPFAALDFSNLLATTWPDRRADAAVGKRTLATRWPASRLRLAHAFGGALCVGLLLVLTVTGVAPLAVGLAGLSATPLILWGIAGYTRRESPAPTVAAMLGLAALLFLGWASVVVGLA